MKKLLILIVFLIATGLFAQVATNQGKETFVQSQPITKHITKPITKHKVKHIQPITKHIKHITKPVKKPNFKPVTKPNFKPVTKPNLF